MESGKCSPKESALLTGVGTHNGHGPVIHFDEMSAIRTLRCYFRKPVNHPEFDFGSMSELAIVHEVRRRIGNWELLRSG